MPEDGSWPPNYTGIPARRNSIWASSTRLGVRRTRIFAREEGADPLLPHKRAGRWVGSNLPPGIQLSERILNPHFGCQGAETIKALREACALEATRTSCASDGLNSRVAPKEFEHLDDCRHLAKEEDGARPCP